MRAAQFVDCCWIQCIIGVLESVYGEYGSAVTWWGVMFFGINNLFMESVFIRTEVERRVFSVF